MAAWARIAAPSRGYPMEGEESDRASSSHEGRDAIFTIYPQEGINRSLPAQQLGEKESWDLVNLYYSREGALPSVRPGVALYDSDTALPGPITSVFVHRYSDSNDVTQSVVLVACLDDVRGSATTQKLYYIDAATGDFELLVSSLGDKTPATFASHNGSVIIAVSGEHLREWQPANNYGENSGDPGVKATNSVTFHSSNKPVVGTVITIDDEAFTYADANIGAFEIDIAPSAGSATATAFAAAVNAYSCRVSAAVDGSDNKKVNLTSLRTGTVGNAYILTETKDDQGAITIGAATFSGGLNGIAVDEIATPGHPTPAIVINGKTGDLVAAGNPGEPYRIYFSAANDAWDWDRTNGGGEMFDIGIADGTTVSAICFRGTELIAHRRGQGGRLTRLDLSRSAPADWTSTPFSIVAGAAAVNQQSVASLYTQHLFMDRRGFSSLTGTDTFDEVQLQTLGKKVWDFLDNADTSEAFCVVDPDEVVMLVFPRFGNACCVLHYGSGRWTRYEFSSDCDFTCGAYHYEEGLVLLGDEDGHVYKLDPTNVATDLGTAFRSTWTTRALGESTMKKVLVKHVIFDWQQQAGGSGVIDALANNEEWPAQRLGDFTVTDQALTLWQCKVNDYDLYDLSDRDLSEVTYGRTSLHEVAEGELLALRVRLYGALRIHSLTVRAAGVGRATI